VPLTVTDFLRLPAVKPDAVSRYGDGPDTFGHLHRPAGAGPHPVGIVLHGGCWQAPYDLRPMGSLCAALAREGIAAWSLEYRRLGGGGGWPATFLDVAAGADHLRALADAHALDLSRVVTLGHSAGGHLALWLAARHRLPAHAELATRDPLAVRGVVALAALGDLAEGLRLGLCGEACGLVLGGAPEPPAGREAQGSPARLLPLGVPHRHIVGAEDTIVPPGYVRAFVESAARAGDDARVQVIADAGHFECASPATVMWPVVLAATRELLGAAEERGEWQAFRRGS
jgi:acetyl esterase/lipase